MAIHELTANAAKYGALSVYGGKVEVSWAYDRRYAPYPEFRLGESGGPPVTHNRSVRDLARGCSRSFCRGRFRPEAALILPPRRVHCELPLPAQSNDAKLRADL
jgi:two-component sensor histidine kinase